MRYTFKKQLAKGEEQEAVLDKFFRSRGFKIVMADMTDQRRGIDRWFEASVLPSMLAIEYKADFRAHDTGNLYLETVSVGKYDTNGDWFVEKKGWLYTTQSDYLMYLIVGEQRVLLFVPDDLRELAESKKWRSVTVKNKGYSGRGLLVPIDEAAKVAKRDWAL